MYLQLLRLSLSNIFNEKRRSWLTVIGIFIGIAAVVGLVSLGQGLEQAIVDEFESIGADKVQVVASDLTDDDLDVVARADGVDIVGGYYQTSQPVRHNGESRFALVVGVPTDDGLDMIQEVTSTGVSDGRHIRRTDRTNVVITQTIAENMFDQEVGLRDTLRINNTDFRVVGIVEPSGPQFENWIYLPIDQVRTLFNREGDLTRIIVQVQDGFTVEGVAANIEEEMRRDRGLAEGEEDFTVFTMQDVLGSFRSILSVVQAVVIGIASISLLVGGVGIMNTMYTSVSERTREIGIMKAVGAKDRQVLIIFLLESAIIGFIGGMIGVLLGAGMSIGVVEVASRFTSVPVGTAITPQLVIGALLFSSIVGMLSGVFPARKAAHMEPVDALRYE